VIAEERRQRRAADAAERPRLSRRGFVPGDQGLAGHPLKRRCRNGRARPERRAGRLAAHRTVAVDHPSESAVDPIPDAPAEATSLDAHPTSSRSRRWPQLTWRSPVHRSLSVGAKRRPQWAQVSQPSASRRTATGGLAFAKRGTTAYVVPSPWQSGHSRRVAVPGSSCSHFVPEPRQVGQSSRTSGL